MKMKIKSGIAIIILLVLVVALSTGLRVVAGESLSWEMILLHIKLTFYSALLTSLIAGIVALLIYWVLKD